MRSIIFSCVLFVTFFLTAYSQENEAIPTVSEENVMPIFRNSIGIGTNAVVGDMSLLNRPRLMYSLSYSYQVSQLLSIEGSVNFLSGTSFGASSWSWSFSYPAGNPIPWTPRQRIISIHSLSGDMNVVFSPFQNIEGWSNLRGGVGISLRSAGILQGGFSVNIYKPTEYEFSIQHSLQTALGANARLEYLVPLNEVLDLGFRLYAQAFLPPLNITGDAIAIGRWDPSTKPIPQEGINRIAIGAVGLGIFLYMNF